MGNIYTSDQLVALSKEKAFVKCFVEVIYTSTISPFTWRFCSGGLDAVLDSNLYTARPMQVSGITRGEMSLARVTVKLDNRDGVLGAEPGINGRIMADTEVNVYMKTSDNGVIWTDPVTIIEGGMVRNKLADNFEFEVSVTHGQRRRAALAKGTRTCNNTFQGPLCQDTSTYVLYCDHTYDMCKNTFANEEHFNSARLAPEPGDLLPTADGYAKVSGKDETYIRKRKWDRKDGNRDLLGPPNRPPYIFVEDTIPLEEL